MSSEILTLMEKAQFFGKTNRTFWWLFVISLILVFIVPAIIGMITDEYEYEYNKKKKDFDSRKDIFEKETSLNMGKRAKKRNKRIFDEEQKELDDERKKIDKIEEKYYLSIFVIFILMVLSIILVIIFSSKRAGKVDQINRIYNNMDIYSVQTEGIVADVKYKLTYIDELKTKVVIKVKNTTGKKINYARVVDNNSNSKCDIVMLEPYEEVELVLIDEVDITTERTFDLEIKDIVFD